MSDDFPSPQMVDAGGVKLAIYEVDGDPERARPPLILLHGWPEIAYSWRNQLHAFAAAGWRVIALDLKGFGASDAPADVALYDADHVTGDYCALMDALEIDKAVFCGHDWGGVLVWAMGQLHPDRTSGVISVCTPAMPRPPAPPLSIFKAMFGEKHYFIQFQEPDVPEALFSSDIERFFKMVFQKPAPREAWPALIPGVYDLPGRFKSDYQPSDDLVVTAEAYQKYVDAYKRSGFTGGINLYRNIDRNWANMEGRDQTVRAPSLWVGAELDLFIPPERAEGMEAIIPDLEKHVIAGSGHWVSWEKPEELNTVVIDWLTRRISG